MECKSRRLEDCSACRYKVPMSEFQELEAFVSTVEHGSQSAAAVALGISRMAVSRLIRGLEDRAARALLNRTTRSQSLTEAGQRFFREAKKILEGYDRALREGDGTHPTKLRVGAPISFAVRRLMPSVGEFAALNPDIELELMLSDRHANLADEGLDLAVRIGNRTDPALDTKLVTYSRTVICGAPSYLERAGAPQIPADLINHNCLRYSYADHGHDWILRDGEGKAYRVPIRGALSCNNGDALVAAAVAGAGLVLQPYFLVADELVNGRLVRVLGSYKTKQFSVQLVTIPTACPRREVAKLSQFLYDSLRLMKC